LLLHQPLPSRFDVTDSITLETYGREIPEA